MGSQNLSENQSENDEFLASIFTLAKEAVYAALVLLVLSGMEWLVECLHLNQMIKNFIVTVHEWSAVAIFGVLAFKSVVRVAATNWRQICKLLNPGS